MTIRTRIAPSPTGEPHIGNIYTALLNYAFAKKNGGKFVLRIEDTDRNRFVEGAQEKFISTLEWFGIVPDEGPVQGGGYGPYLQSERLDIYKKLAHQLVEEGHAYYCFCSAERLEQVRQEQKQNHQQPRYDRHCRNLSKEEIEKRLKAGDPFVIRMKVPLEGQVTFNDLLRGEVTIDYSQVNDQVLLKSDGYPTYHLAVVIDDHLMKISHVMRAEEWISSMPKQVFLYQAFGWEMPQFAHTPLLRNTDGSKLSKRKNSVSAVFYQEQGYLPEALKNYLTRLGWSHPKEKEIYNYQEFIKLFSLDRVLTSAPIFDIDKLNWINGMWIREEITEERYLKEFMQFVPEEIKSQKENEEKLKFIAGLQREKIKYFAEVPSLVDYFFEEDVVLDAETILKYAKEEEKLKKMLEVSLESLIPLKKWEVGSLEKTLRKVGKENDWKNKEFFMSLRLVTTGREATPPLFDTLFILGREKVVSRLEKAIMLFH